MPDSAPTNYKGRFAPSPTGEVHFGTLLTAVASYLQAKKNNGQWLVRIEDVDVTRRVKGSADGIIHTLEAFDFEWHGEILYQSKQTEYYENALQQLMSQALVFPCTCSRKQLNETNDDIYPGTCRSNSLPEKNDHALRILANDANIEFTDCIMGRQSQNIKQQCGDFIIKRRDDLFAYQLAVVVDDAMQGINEIVRGADLLSVTPRQIYLQQLLGYTTPAYCHLPLAIDNKGNKISKSEGTAKVAIKNKEALLFNVLAFLSQEPPADLSDCNINDIWRWAIDNWNIDQIPHSNRVCE